MAPRNVLVLIAVWLFAAVSAGSLRAELVFSEPVAEVGEVRAGAPLVRQLAFVNRGPGQVEITGLRASCGCLKPHLEQHKYQSGEHGVIELEVNTLSQAPGPHEWQVHVTYKLADITNEVLLRLRARVITEVTVEPAALTFFADKALAHDILLTDLRPHPLSITEVRTSSPHLKSQVVDAYCDDAGHQVRKMRLVVASDYPEGRHDEILGIYTDDPSYRELKVPVTVIKQGRQRLVATPDEVRLEAPRGQPIPSRIVLLRDRQDQQVEIESINADHPAIKCQWAKGPGVMSTVKVQIDYRQLTAETLQSAVHIHCSKPLPLTMTIPVDMKTRLGL